MNTWKTILSRMILIKAHKLMEIAFLKLDHMHNFLLK